MTGLILGGFWDLVSILTTELTTLPAIGVMHLGPVRETVNEFFA